MKRIMAVSVLLLLFCSMSACIERDPYLDDDWTPPETTVPVLQTEAPTQIPDITEPVVTAPVVTEKQWAALKWVCIGDSITENNDRADRRYFDYISDDTGITVINMGISGTGFKSREGEDDFGDSYYQRIERIPTDADIITIVASGNDLYLDADLGDVTDEGTDTICGCINTTLDRLQERFPSAVIGIITSTPWKEFDPADDENPMALYSDVIIEICKLRGIPCLDLYRNSGLQPWSEEGREEAFSRDGNAGCHPDENGHAMFAPYIKAFLETII